VDEYFGVMRPGLYPGKVAPGSRGLRTALITYDGLPSRPHSLGRRDAIQVWRSVSGFISECASISHQKQELAVRGLDRKPAEAEKQVLSEAQSLFGEPRVGRTGPRGEIRENTFALRPEQIGDVAAWVVSHGSTLPVNLGDYPGWPSLQAAISMLFILVDPTTGALLPHQGTEQYGGQGFDGYCASGLGESRMRVGLTNGSCWCYVALSFPFEEPTEGFRAYADQLQRRLPFEFSDKHWARWQLNKAGTAYYSRKIQPRRG